MVLLVDDVLEQHVLIAKTALGSLQFSVLHYQRKLSGGYMYIYTIYVEIHFLIPWTFFFPWKAERPRDRTPICWVIPQMPRRSRRDRLEGQILSHVSGRAQLFFHCQLPVSASVRIWNWNRDRGPGLESCGFGYVVWVHSPKSNSL